MSRTELARIHNQRIDALTGKLYEKSSVQIGKPADLKLVREEWAGRDGIPLHVAGREAAQDNSWPGLDLRTYLAGDDSAGHVSVHDILVPPGEAFPSHCLSEGDIFICVIEGTPRLTVGNLSQTSLPRTFGYIPANTTFAFQNEGAAAARLLYVVAPAGAELGFAEAHRHWIETGDEKRESYYAILARFGFRFDLEGPLENDARVNQPLTRMDASVGSFDDFMAMRKQWTERPPTPRLMHDLSGCYSLSVPDGPTFAHSRVAFSGDDTRGRAVLFYGEIDAKYSAPPHYQPSEEELFFLLDGELDLVCGNRAMHLQPGYFGFAPRGATHGFRNAGDTVARIITINAPAGHERGFEMIEDFMKNPREGLEDQLSNHGWQMHSMDGMGEDGTHAEGYANQIG